MCVYVWVYAHVSAGACRVQERAPDPLELEFQVVYQPPQVWDLNLHLWQEQCEVLHLNLHSTIPQHMLFLKTFYFKTRSH